MASWAEFEAAEPEFAARVSALLTRRRHLTMATLRRDGGPRISGIEVRIGDDHLAIGSMPGAMKARDLRRDPRVAIHGPTVDPPEGDAGGWEGEAKVAGRAREVEPDRFVIEIEEAVITSLNSARDGLLIESWTPARGYRRQERA